MNDETTEIAHRLFERPVDVVDFRHALLGGGTQHLLVAAASLDRRSFDLGIPFDGVVHADGPRATRGVLLRPDVGSARLDPRRGVPTLAVRCEASSMHGEPPDDARAVARRAVAFLAEAGLDDEVWVGASAPFTIAGADGPTARDLPAELASRLVVDLAAAGLAAAVSFGVGRPDDIEVVLRPAPLLATADALSDVPEIVADVGERLDVEVGIRPGASLAMRHTLRRARRSRFFDAASLSSASATMLHFVGGVLDHARALLAFAPLDDAAAAEPSLLAFSAEAAAAAVLLKDGATVGTEESFVEFRAASAVADPYLTAAAVLMAGLDGIERGLDPIRAGLGPLPAPRGRDPHPGVAALSRDPRVAVDALRADTAFLRRGDVFGGGLLERWIERRSMALGFG